MIRYLLPHAVAGCREAQRIFTLGLAMGSDLDLRSEIEDRRSRSDPAETEVVMRYLQTRILVWYLATLVVSLIAFVSISITVGTRETRKNVGHLLEMQVEGSIRAYEEGGPQALSKYLQRMDTWFTSTHYLVDVHNRDMVSG